MISARKSMECIAATSGRNYFKVWAQKTVPKHALMLLKNVPKKEEEWIIYLAEDAFGVKVC